MTSAPEETATPLCGTCRGHGHCRLGVGELVRDGQCIRAELVCAERFHAGPGVAHGGWTAAVFDDVMGRSMVKRGVQTVTGSLTVDFLKPVPIEEPLVIAVQVDGHEGRRWMLSAVLRLARDEAPLARAHGIWVERRQGHFERHEAAMDSYRSSDD